MDRGRCAGSRNDRSGKGVAVNVVKLSGRQALLFTNTGTTPSTARLYPGWYVLSVVGGVLSDAAYLTQESNYPLPSAGQTQWKGVVVSAVTPFMFYLQEDVDAFVYVTGSCTAVLQRMEQVKES